MANQYGNSTMPTPAATATPNTAARDSTPALDPETRSSRASRKATHSTGPAKSTTPNISVTWCAAAAARLTATPLTSDLPEDSVIHS